VRQSRRFPLWRVSHAYHPEAAHLLVSARGEQGGGRAVRRREAKLGDVFYDGVAARADPMIEQWMRETGYEEKP
jgi:hypothetical protein